jgi:anaerobic magnesium-protoporphyrin IX monomethyl ester cyclase
LCEKIKKTGVKWHCLGRTDQSDLEVYKLMREAGCMGIDFGIESGSQKMLDLVNKNVTVKRQEQGLKAASEAGLLVRAQLMIGLPQETDETILETINFIKRNKPYVTKWGVHTFIPFPSCDIYNNPEKYKYTISKDFKNFQTIGKKDIWNYVPIDFKDKIDGWRKQVLEIIGKGTIQK